MAPRQHEAPGADHLIVRPLGTPDPHDPVDILNVRPFVPESPMLTFAPFRCLAVSFCAVALALVAAPTAQAQVFSNNSAITIPDIGTATPYPSTINVTGMVGQPVGLRVRLKSFSHTFPGDVAVLLVAPNGQGIELLSRNGGNASAFRLALAFGAESTTPLPQPLATGVFVAAGGNNGFAAPANAIPRATSLASLLAGTPNGQWKLFVEDFVNSDAGSIADGWEVEFFDFGDLPITPLSQSMFMYQGRLDGGMTSGTIDARFSLWNDPSLSDSANRVAGPPAVSGIVVTNGLFTTPVYLGVPVPADIQTWLQVEISSPAGAPFVALTPRQPITATPLAGVAYRAVFADTATNATNATIAISATNATNAANAINAINATNATVAASVPWSGLTGQANVSTGAIGTGWQMLFTNSANATFRGGMRLADSGFLELTNSASSPTPNLARLSSTGGWTAVSDARLKTNVTTAEGNLAAAMKLRPVNFRWKGDGAEDFGLIAQEVRAVLPKLVTGDEAKDSLTLNYSQLSVVAIGAIQELKAENDALKARIVALENTVTQSAVTQSGMTRTQAAGLSAGVVLPLLVIAAFRRRKS
jgi:subtilisin-like proprotein convertase family protein